MYARLILGSRIVSAAGREVEKQTGERGKSLLSGPVCKHPPVNQRDTVKRTVNSKAIESINSNNSLERGRDANPGGRERETERERRETSAGCQVSDEWRRVPPSYSFLRERLELSVSQRDHRDRWTRATSPPRCPSPSVVVENARNTGRRD